jgi:hypothetical protein
MNKVLALKVTNPLLFAALVLQAATGIILALRLFLTVPKLYVFIGELHEYNGFVFVALAAFHLYLNWGWVKSQLLKR